MQKLSIYIFVVCLITKCKCNVLVTWVLQTAYGGLCLYLASLRNQIDSNPGIWLERVMVHGLILALWASVQKHQIFWPWSPWHSALAKSYVGWTALRGDNLKNRYPQLSLLVHPETFQEPYKALFLAPSQCLCMLPLQPCGALKCQGHRCVHLEDLGWSVWKMARRHVNTSLKYNTAWLARTFCGLRSWWIIVGVLLCMCCTPRAILMAMFTASFSVTFLKIFRIEVF